MMSDDEIMSGTSTSAKHPLSPVPPQTSAKRSKHAVTPSPSTHRKKKVMEEHKRIKNNLNKIPAQQSLQATNIIFKDILPDDDQLNVDDSQIVAQCSTKIVEERKAAATSQSSTYFQNLAQLTSSLCSESHLPNVHTQQPLDPPMTAPTDRSGKRQKRKEVNSCQDGLPTDATHHRRIFVVQGANEEEVLKRTVGPHGDEDIIDGDCSSLYSASVSLSYASKLQKEGECNNVVVAQDRSKVTLSTKETAPLATEQDGRNKYTLVSLPPPSGGNHGMGAIKTIRLENIRIFQGLDVEAAESLNVVIGENGSGKSTVLFAIYVGLGGSQDVQANHLIPNGKDEGKIIITLSSVHDEDFTVTCSLLRNRQVGKKTFSVAEGNGEPERYCSPDQLKELLIKKFNIDMESKFNRFFLADLLYVTTTTPAALLSDFVAALGPEKRNMFNKLKQQGQKQMDNLEQLSSYEEKLKECLNAKKEKDSIVAALVLKNELGKRLEWEKCKAINDRAQTLTERLECLTKLLEKAIRTSEETTTRCREEKRNLKKVLGQVESDGSEWKALSAQCPDNDFMGKVYKIPSSQPLPEDAVKLPEGAIIDAKDACQLLNDAFIFSSASDFSTALQASEGNLAAALILSSTALEGLGAKTVDPPDAQLLREAVDRVNNVSRLCHEVFSIWRGTVEPLSQSFLDISSTFPNRMEEEEIHLCNTMRGGDDESQDQERALELLRSGGNASLQELYNGLERKYGAIDELKVKKERNELRSRCKELERASASAKETVEASEKDYVEKFLQVNRFIQDDVDAISEVFGNLMKAVGYSGQVSLEMGSKVSSDEWGIQVRCRLATRTVLQRLSTSASGGEKSVASTLFLLAAQTRTKNPFFCLDEASMGCDTYREAALLSLAGEMATETKKQIFFITPKSLPRVEKFKSSDLRGNSSIHVFLRHTQISSNEEDDE